MTQHQSNSTRQYTQLTPEDRGMIDALYHSDDCSIRMIAQEIGRSPSTVSRELKRGTVQQMDSQRLYYRDYYADAAQILHDKRRANSRPHGLLVKCHHFFQWLDNRVKKEHFRRQSIDGLVHLYQQLFPHRACPATSTVYRYIDQGLLKIDNMDLPEKLRRHIKGHHRNHDRKNKKIAGTSIEQRPKVVNERQTYGDWEGDLVKGKRTVNEPALLTLTERRTRFELIYKIPDYHAQTCLQALQWVLDHHGAGLFHSITFDNGSEFALLNQVKGTKIYYCHPYTPSERGSNENANGLIREFIPKGISLHKFSKKLIRKVQDVLNGRLRKSLGYRSASAALQASPLGLEVPPQAR